MSLLARSLFAIALGLCLVTGSARASQVVFGNLGSGGGGDITADTVASISSTTWFAHGFTVGGTNTFLTSVAVGLRGAGSATVALYANAGGSPSSSLASVTQSISASLSDPPALQSFNFSNFSLSAGVSYWVVVSGSSATAANWAFNAEGDFPTEQNSSGWSPLSPVTKRSTDSGSTWTTNNANRPASLSIVASSSAPEPIPEPGTWVAAALLIGLAGYVRWRRRAQAA